MALTPGHSNANGALYRTFDPGSQILRCFQCHSTGPLRLAANNKIQVSEAGVRCEACHGPGADHVKRGGDKRAIFNPAHLTAAAMNEFCGACHRKPPAAGDDIEHVLTRFRAAMDDDLDTPTASMAKWWLTEVQCQVTDRCLQLFRGLWLHAGVLISRLYTDARVQKIYGGANEVMKDVIARSL